jgi:SAM-dependent methyltransferase
MTQNIYDDETFFAGYSRLPRSITGLDGMPEWPSMQAMLPDLKGRAVVDLGCGFGWFCRWAGEQGAASVLGLDVSENMLARARAETADPAIAYERADLDRLALPEAAFDLAYSALCLHYLENLAALFAVVHRALVPGGCFVFSAEHPIMTAPAIQGWRVTEDGQSSWPVYGYLDEGRRVTDWLAPGVVKQHRTIATYLNLLIGSGFIIERVEEWGPSPEQIAAHPEWKNEVQRPPFLLVAARR